jgi:hypothetical protein
MKIREIIEPRPQQSAAIQPSLVKQQARVGQVVAQIAASDQQQAPTEMEKVMAMRQYANMKKRTDKAYRQRLRQQLANAEARLK